MLQVYGQMESGNCYKVAMILERLKMTYNWIELDVTKGSTQTPEFIKLNPNGKVPLLVLEDGTCLPESNAILWYLAEGSAWIPDNRLARAQMLQWMFFEQYSHEPAVAVARFWLHFLKQPKEYADQLPAKHAAGYKALAIMEQQLARTPYLVGETETLADLALYAYTHVANEGGFDLAAYPALNAWLVRIASHLNHKTMR